LTDFRGKPFLNTRHYVSSNYFSIDFFHDTASPSYLADFEQVFVRERGRLLVEAPHAAMRATPLYFTRCPGCSVEVLTNRTVGKNLQCRWCNERAATAVVHEERLASLLALVLTLLGKTTVDLSGRAQVVLFHVTDAQRVQEVVHLGDELGFTPVPSDHHVATTLKLQAAHGIAGIPEDSHSIVLRKLADAGTTGYAGETTPDVEILVMTVRECVGETWSASLTYQPSDTDIRTLGFEQRYDELIEQFRQELAKEPLAPVPMMALAQTLLLHGDAAEAESLSANGATLWPDDHRWWNLLGFSLTKGVKYARAVKAFKKSLDLNPIQVEVLAMLAECHRRTGDEGAALRAEGRAAGLGSPVKWTI
jgi:hypothetical protein